jgi:tetratricopeptide (TPR) repeat protein
VHTVSATASIVCGWLGLAVALDLVLQVLRRGRRLSNGAWLFAGVAAACAAAFFAVWITWLTPLRPWFLTASCLEIMGLFYLLYRCRRRLELFLFGLAFAVAGLALSVCAMRELGAIAEMTAWAKVEGKVTDSGGVRAHESKFWTRQLAYEYSVDGQRFVGCEDSWKSSRMRYGWGKNLSRAWPSYGWKKEVAVYYDPDNPESAVLRPGLSYATAFVLKVSLLSVLGGMALLVVSVQLGQAKASMSQSDGATGVVVKRLGRERSLDWPGRVAFVLLAACALLVMVGIQPISRRAMKVERVDRVPATADEFCQRGLDLLHAHDPRRAFNNFTRALRIDPDDAEACYDRGHALLMMGRVPQAVDDWKKAVELDWRMALNAHYARRRLPSNDVELNQVIANAAFDHLGDLEEISGYAVGYGAGPGEFYTVSLILADCAKEDDFLKMTENANPVIRAMALICLARQDIVRYQTIIRSFLQDATEVGYVPMGCGIGSTSLAALAQNILEDPNTLQYWDPEKTQ